MVTMIPECFAPLLARPERRVRQLCGVQLRAYSHRMGIAHRGKASTRSEYLRLWTGVEGACQWTRVDLPEPNVL